MRNPVAWTRWLVVLIAVGLAVLFFYRVILPETEPEPEPARVPSPSGQVEAP